MLDLSNRLETFIDQALTFRNDILYVIGDVMNAFSSICDVLGNGAIFSCSFHQLDLGFANHEEGRTYSFRLDRFHLVWLTIEQLTIRLIGRFDIGNCNSDVLDLSHVRK